MTEEEFYDETLTYILKTFTFMSLMSDGLYTQYVISNIRDNNHISPESLSYGLECGWLIHLSAPHIICDIYQEVEFSHKFIEKYHEDIKRVYDL